MPRITNRVVDATRPEQKDQFIWDSDLPGFGLRVFPSGRRSYLIQYRVGGRQRRFTLGPHGVLTPAQARQRAAKLLAGVREGDDPSERRHEASEAPTVAEFAETYLERHARPKKKPRSVYSDERLFAKNKSASARPHHERLTMIAPLYLMARGGASRMPDAEEPHKPLLERFFENRPGADWLPG